MKKYFVTAIGTDSGKTLISSILTEFLQADYWKPVQSGEPRDIEEVKKWVKNPTTVFHPEAYLLKTPMSPHAAGKIDNVTIDLAKIQLPKTDNNLIIEGAGGVLVPINETDFVIDIAQQFDCEVILVSNLYLGSINHTLLTINELKRRNIKVKGIIFNGTPNISEEEYILSYSGYPCLLKIKQESNITHQMIQDYVALLENNWE